MNVKICGDNWSDGRINTMCIHTYITANNRMKTLNVRSGVLTVLGTAVPSYKNMMNMIDSFQGHAPDI